MNNTNTLVKNARINAQAAIIKLLVSHALIITI
jgi:hypothetical protein